MTGTESLAKVCPRQKMSFQPSTQIYLIMKTKSLFALLAIASLGLAGCEKSEKKVDEVKESIEKKGDEVKDAVGSKVDEIKDAVKDKAPAPAGAAIDKAADASKDATNKAVDATKDAAKAAVDKAVAPAAPEAPKP